MSDETPEIDAFVVSSEMAMDMLKCFNDLPEMMQFFNQMNMFSVYHSHHVQQITQLNGDDDHCFQLTCKFLCGSLGLLLDFLRKNFEVIRELNKVFVMVRPTEEQLRKYKPVNLGVLKEYADYIKGLNPEQEAT